MPSITSATTPDSPGARNLAIRLTAPGAAAIAVIRLIGPSVPDFLRTHFSRPAPPNRCVHGRLVDGPRVIDDPIVTVRDDRTADIHLHGGPWVVRAAMELAERAGFEIRDAIELPLPDAAVDADDPLEREVLSHLPLARTETGVRALLAQPRAWAKLERDVAAGEDAARRELARMPDDRIMRHLLHPPTVAIVGPANVGKSTLANRLFGQPRSITADVPGTTRDWVGEIAEIDGLPVLLLDTPGVRETADEIERSAVERARIEIARSERVILVLDPTRPRQEQAALEAEFPTALRVLNKSDRPALWAEPSMLRTSALTGDGTDRLRREIVRFFCDEPTIAVDRARCWTERQRAVIERMRNAPLTPPRRDSP